MASLQWNWALDGWIVLAGSLCAVAAALLGNFLVLRRMSMLGDAISHAVLPGLAAAFFLTGERQSFPMFLGAVLVGVLTALFTEWIRGAGRVNEGASMGVVFTSLFALGLVMIVQAADQVDLDPGCVLYGAIELTPLDTVAVGSWQIPRSVLTLGAVALLNLAFVVFFFKELKISSFDPALATTSGFHARLLHYLLMILVAITAVASFESVGNILVVAMFVVPPAAAYMLTDRLTTMIAFSAGLAVIAAVGGHLAAITLPGWWGYQSTSTAGMMAVVAGLLLAIAMVAGPRHGILIKLVQHRLLAWKILAEDVIALLFRLEERGEPSVVTRAQLTDWLLADRWSVGVVLRRLCRRGELDWNDGMASLTDRGRERGSQLVRSHRLWEQYLFSQPGFLAERIHDKAEQLEHFTDRQLRRRLNQATNEPSVDPHGSPIPDEQAGSGSNPTS